MATKKCTRAESWELVKVIADQLSDSAEAIWALARSDAGDSDRNTILAGLRAASEHLQTLTSELHDELARRDDAVAHDDEKPSPKPADTPKDDSFRDIEHTLNDITCRLIGARELLVDKTLEDNDAGRGVHLLCECCDDLEALEDTLGNWNLLHNRDRDKAVEVES